MFDKLLNTIFEFRDTWRYLIRNSNKSISNKYSARQCVSIHLAIGYKDFSILSPNRIKDDVFGTFLLDDLEQKIEWV